MSTDPQEASPRSLIAKDFLRASRSTIYNNMLVGVGLGTGIGTAFGTICEAISAVSPRMDGNLDYQGVLFFTACGMVIGTAFGLVNGAEKREKFLEDGFSRYIDHVAPPPKAEDPEPS